MYSQDVKSAPTPSSRRRTIARGLAACLLLLVMLAGVSCISVKTEHRVDPIHITMDVNVRMEKALDETFSGLDAKASEIAAQQKMQKEEL